VCVRVRAHVGAHVRVHVRARVPVRVYREKERTSMEKEKSLLKIVGMWAYGGMRAWHVSMPLCL